MSPIQAVVMVVASMIIGNTEREEKIVPVYAFDMMVKTPRRNGGERLQAGRFRQL